MPKELPEHQSQAGAESGISLDQFFICHYLPHARQCKRSWQLDERLERRHISPAFGQRPLASIRIHEVQSWFDGLHSSGYANSTCNRIFAVLRSVYRLAVQRGIIRSEDSPCHGLKGFKNCAGKERYLSINEAQNLLNVLKKCSCPQASAILLLLLTGARKSEILKARWENVDLERAILLVPISKSGRPRNIHLSQEAIALIKSLPREPGSAWLFPGRNPEKPISDIFHFWRNLRQRLGFNELRIHDLRHSFASFLVNKGYSLYVVQRLLGHSNPATTMRYAHLRDDVLAEAVNSVVPILKPGPKRRNGRRVIAPLACPV